MLIDFFHRYTHRVITFIHSLWPPWVADVDIIFLPCCFFYLSSSIFFPRLISAVADLMSTILHTWCGFSENLGCRSETCGMRLAENTARQKLPKIAISAPSHNFRTKAMYRQSEKSLLSSNISSRRPHNMANFCQLTADICSGVWGTPPNFNGFRVLAALLHGTLAVGGRRPNFAALNTGRHLYLAGQPSRWVLAHILVHSFIHYDRPA